MRTENTPKLMVIDNYDSFTFNLVQMFMLYDLEISVHRSDKITITETKKQGPDYILISPGPKDPAHSGVSIDLVKTFYQTIPIFGVCLGMQCMNEAFGGVTVRAPVPVHGKTSQVQHNNEGIFKNLPSPFLAARYHSLSVRPLNRTLSVTATSEDNVVMGLSHPVYPLHGVQFHPESFMTEKGLLLIENFLKLGPLKNSLGSVRNTQVV